jgi:NTE family protein
MSESLGLVLTGGGARGSYQAGALLAIAEITHAHELPFRVISGSSAGSVNATYLASHAHDFGRATRGLLDLWACIEPRQVFRTDVPTLAKTAAEWIADLGFGGVVGAGRGKALLDTAPLTDLLRRHFDRGGLERALERELVHGIGVTATSYESGLAVTFFEGAEAIKPWNRVTRLGVRTKLEICHIMASSAIPIFFPAIPIEGEWYADGSIRLATPLSPAVRMGAEKILAIAVRPSRDAVPPLPTAVLPAYPTAAEAAGVLLDAMFLDALESDVERASRINQTLKFLSPDVRAKNVVPLKPVELLVLRPSRDPGALVLRTLDRFPAPLRYMFRGLGASGDAGWELLSYLAFDGAYTARLCELGYEDTMARADEIRAFLHA